MVQHPCLEVISLLTSPQVSHIMLEEIENKEKKMSIRNNPRRYTIRETEETLVEVTFFFEDCDGKDYKTTQEWWAPPGGGYVREVSDRRPGTLGQQLYDQISSVRGSTWYWHGQIPLVDVARLQLRALFRKHPDYCELLSLEHYNQEDFRCEER